MATDRVLHGSAMSGILTDSQIRQRTTDQKLIEGFSDACIAPASYELRIGRFRDPDTQSLVELNEGEVLEVQSGGFILLGTIERVNLPLDLVGVMYLRSSYARRGFTSWFQGLVDPGYEGKLTVALHNVSRANLALLGGDRICHLVFEQLPEKANRPYSGNYNQSEGATPAPILKIPAGARVVRRV